MTDGQGKLCYDAEFTPYGQEMSHTERLQTTACSQNYKFTGYENDQETGLYYSLARYYNPRLGRFMSTDPLAGSTGDPQSMNRYSYVGNRALSSTDTNCLTAK
jgi:RHS repeat-associated protein